MAQLTTSCTVRGGKLKLFDLRGFERNLSVFCDGEALELYLESASERHTRAQERFLHGPVLKAFAELGYPKQEAKDMLALRFIPQDIRQLDGSIVRVPGHTSALTKADYTAFIEQAIQLAAEHGVVVQDGQQWLAEQRAKRRKVVAA